MKIRWLYMIPMVFGAIAALVAIIQFVIAICFMELGRMLFYIVIAYLFTWLAVWSIQKMIVK